MVLSRGPDMTFILGFIGFFFIVGVIAAACQAIGGLYWELKEGIHRTPRIGAARPQVKGPVMRRGLISAGVWVGIVLLLALLLSGCATPGILVTVTAAQGMRLTEAQQLVDTAWQPRQTPAPQVRLYAPREPGEGGEYNRRRHIISLTPVALEGREWRAILAHEAGHALLGHDGSGCGSPCEIAADRRALMVMIEAWQIPRDDAVFQICTVLNGSAYEAVNSGRAVRGHDPVAEYNAFVRENNLGSGCRPRGD
jgi:hypothetical protein